MNGRVYSFDEGKEFVILYVNVLGKKDEYDGEIKREEKEILRVYLIDLLRTYIEVVPKKLREGFKINEYWLLKCLEDNNSCIKKMRKSI
ncbi:MAG: hypothetical protein Q7S27_05175 [Nanoarchaeota archaeon]|nr:hypothetical protein [Nanoarchaeota archaeon]